MNNNKIKLIGLCGYARSGKDTAFLLLNDLIPDKFTRFAFADALKDDLRPFVKQHFGLDIYLCNNEQKEKIRDLMIAFGCCQRNFNPNYWIEKLQQKIEILDRYNYDLIPVISDIRFANEAKFFRDKYGDGFKLIEIVRTDATLIPPDQELANHPKLKPFIDFTIAWPTKGDDKLNELKPYVVECYNHLFNK